MEVLSEPARRPTTPGAVIKGLMRSVKVTINAFELHTLLLSRRQAKKGLRSFGVNRLLYSFTSLDLPFFIVAE